MSYVFWIHGWNNIRRLENWNDLIQCVLDTQGVYIIDHNKSRKIIANMISISDDIKISSIPNIQRYYVRLLLLGGEEIFVFPANPLMPIYKSYHETVAFKNIITSIRNGETPTEDPNPYIRQLHQRDTPRHLRNVQAKWDPDVSPWIYYHRYKDDSGFIKLLVVMILSVIFSIAIVFLLAYLLDTLGII